MSVVARSSFLSVASCYGILGFVLHTACCYRECLLVGSCGDGILCQQLNKNHDFNLFKKQHNSSEGFKWQAHILTLILYIMH